MKVLIVCSGNTQGFVFERNQAFVYEQMKAIENTDSSVSFDTFFLTLKGLFGYLKQIKLFNNKINEFQPDLIHAHYGLSGLFANLQRRIPVITTYHGSDINNTKSRFFSKLSILLSHQNIFVSSKLAQIAKAKRNYTVIPCGVTLSDYPLIDKINARKSMGLQANEKIVLFSSAFDNVVKNAPLAKAALEELPDVKMIELKGYSRSQVNLLLRAADVALMTSLTEGSPQFIKEAMVTCCPIVSVDVGDVKDIVANTPGCYIAERTPNDIALKIETALQYGRRTNGLSRIKELGLCNDKIAKRIIDIYNSTK